MIIIGGGASGLMCAFTAARRGRRVLVVERSAKLGRKILMSGGGRCNFTNLFVEPENYLCDNPHFVKSALKRYTQWDFIALVEAHGIRYHERDHGQLFCDDSARDILDLLVAECEQAGVAFRTRCEINDVETSERGAEGGESRFVLRTDKGVLACESLVVATGGLSIPSMGGGGFGHRIARQFGLNIVPPRAGLVPFTLGEPLKGVSERLSGLALEATLFSGGHAFTEALLFTHRGLSGPAVLQLSNYWRLGEEIEIDLLPRLDMGEWLRERKREQPRKLLRTLLGELLAKGLVRELERLHWSDWAERPIAELPDAVLAEVAERINRWRIQPTGTEGYRTAEVTLGGVDTRQLSSKSMESSTQPGLYFIGETMDVAGHLGGYNFQWAWSSGHAAGECV